MKFRNHPAFVRWGGFLLWPPQWSKLDELKEDWPHGEIGTLESVWMHELLDRCVFMHVEHDGCRYIGSLYFEDRASCMMMYNFLKSVVGRSIAEIGDLDVSHLL